MQHIDMLDARMRHRRRAPGYTPTETLPAIPVVPSIPVAAAQRRRLSRDWLGILVILPITFLGIALVVGAGTWGDAQDHVRVVHQTRVLTRWREHAVTVTATPAPQIRTVAAQPQVRTIAVTMRPAAPRPAAARPAPTITVTVSARPAPAVTVTVTASPSPTG
jgi:hypothetical protein